MRLFYSYIIFFIVILPLLYWYANSKNLGTTLVNLPGKAAGLNIVYLFCALLLYILVPTYREHIEPSITVIAMMLSEGYPAYTKFDDPNVYSILYGPVTYLFQAEFLKLFSNPILGSKIYGVLCFSFGMVFLAWVLMRTYGLKNMLYGMFYFTCIVLLFAQVSYRNQSDSIIILGNSLAAGSVLLPGAWLSKLFLAFGSALSINAKFHAIGYIAPLIWYFYQLHGLRGLITTGLLCLGLVFSPFLLDAYNYNNFITTMQAYSNLQIHPRIFLHNLSTAYIIYLPLFLFSIFLIRSKSSKVSIASTETLWTFSASNLMLILVCLTAAIDGAGSYHLVHFAPAFAVIYTIYHSDYSKNVSDHIAALKRGYKTILFTSILAWYLAVGVFVASVQKKYIGFIHDNYNSQIPMELLAIKAEIQQNHWRVFFGYADEESYPATYYRPILWPVIKDNVLDPVALMGRKAVGIKIPDTFATRLAQQYYDVIIIPKPGKPFSMINWHDVSQPIFGENIQKLFLTYYTPLKEYKHFVLWQAADRVNIVNKLK